MSAPTAMPYYTVPEAAAVLRVSEKTIRRQITAGKLAAYRIGARLIISDKALTEMLDKSGRT